MSVTAVAAPIHGNRSTVTTARLVLIAMAVAVLLAVSFFVGRVTVATSHGSTNIVPAAHTSAGVDSCPRLRYC